MVTDTQDVTDQESTNGEYVIGSEDPRITALGKQLGNQSLAADLIAVEDGEAPSKDRAPDLLAASDKLAQKALTRYRKIREQHDSKLSAALTEYHRHAGRSGKISAVLIGE